MSRSGFTLEAFQTRVIDEGIAAAVADYSGDTEHRRQMREGAVAGFEAGHPTVIVDATNTTRKRRDKWRDRAWEVSFHELAISADECIRRARAIGDEDIVPIIERMAEELEPVAEDERSVGVQA